MSSLLSLPTELLQRIAGFLPCSAALNLVRVNRQLHAACNDRLVFKYIAQHFLEHNISGTSASLEWPEANTVLNDASLQDTIRLAYAVERAVVRASEHHPVWLYGFDRGVVHRDVREWLPHLLALRFPGYIYLKAEDLLHLHLEFCYRRRRNTADVDQVIWNRDRTDFINVGFCLGFLALHGLGDAAQRGEVNRDNLFKMGNNLTDSHLESYEAFETWGLNPPRPDVDLTSVRFGLGQAAASILPWLYNIRESENHGRIPLPQPSHMPFSSYMSIPPVYHDSALEFSVCHIEHMTKPEFLSGQWMGYYTDQRWYRPIYKALTDGPMRSINLIARPRDDSIDRPSAHVTAIVDRDSRGIDSHGEFQLFGEIHENGQVQILKTYLAQGWEWMWSGIVTPFGILGHWGDFGGRFGGYFWIWKKEWCA